MIIPVAYLDTSAFLRLFIDEGGMDKTWVAIQEINTLYASRLVLTEACVTLARLKRGSRVSQEEYQAARQAMQDFWVSSITSVPLSESIHQAAGDLALTHPLRSAGALHLATALDMRRSLPKDLPAGFLAYDLDLLKAAAALRFITLPD